MEHRSRPGMPSAKGVLKTDGQPSFHEEDIMRSAYVASSRSFRRARQWIAVALAGLFSALLGSPADARCTQPVYVIAHRCNDVGDVSSVVSAQGVNAVEADFRYSDGQWFVDHD